MEAKSEQLAVLKNILHHFSASTGLKVNFHKSLMVPINLETDSLDRLAHEFGCQTGSFPFTYLGLPLGTTKPNIIDFLPLMQKIERRLCSTSSFLTQGGRLEMVKSVFSSSAVFHISTLKLHKGVIKQIEKYLKHCLWRGSDMTSKKPSKAAWELVCLPKQQGGLGVINLSVHHEALLLKFLHKFYSKAPVPWVRLVWEHYYANGSLPGQQRRGSFWWRDVVSLLMIYKKFVSVTPLDGDTVLFWDDRWHGDILNQQFPELASFSTCPNATLKEIKESNSLIQHFHLPLSQQAYMQFQDLYDILAHAQQNQGNDQWIFNGANSTFSSLKIYKQIIGQRAVHPAFHWLWQSKCQMKHKVFFWLVLRDRISTRDILSRRNMHLDSYNCEMCILQRRETTSHLLLRCNFAKACWLSIGISVITTRSMVRIFKRIKESLQLTFFMEIIVLMTWCIWTTRNDWLFNDIPPSVQACKNKFLREFDLVILRSKSPLDQEMAAWLQNL